MKDLAPQLSFQHHLSSRGEHAFHPSPLNPEKEFTTETQSSTLTRRVARILDKVFAEDVPYVWLFDYGGMALFYQIENYAHPGSKLRLPSSDRLLQESPVIVENYRREFNIDNPLCSHPPRSVDDPLHSCLQANMIYYPGSTINGVLRAVTQKVRKLFCSS